MIVNICAVIVAAAFGILAFYAVLTLRDARRSLEQARLTLNEAERQVDAVKQEAVPLLKAGHKLACDVQAKLDDIGPMWGSVRRAGQSMERAADAVGRASRSVVQTAMQTEKSLEAGRERFADAAEWIGTGVKLWQTWQAHRREKP